MIDPVTLVQNHLIHNIRAWALIKRPYPFTQEPIERPVAVTPVSLFKHNETGFACAAIHDREYFPCIPLTDLYMQEREANLVADYLLTARCNDFPLIIRNWDRQLFTHEDFPVIMACGCIAPYGNPQDETAIADWPISPERFRTLCPGIEGTQHILMYCKHGKLESRMIPVLMRNEQGNPCSIHIIELSPEEVSKVNLSLHMKKALQKHASQKEGGET